QNFLKGQTILPLQSSPVPVPRVYALFQDTTENGTSCSYILMEHIRGFALSSLCPSINAMAKKAVAFRFCVVFDSMCTLKSPRGYCSVGRGGLPNGLFWTDLSHPYAGPFETEAELYSAVVTKYAANAPYKGKANYYAHAFKGSF
ncbi:hypothetical protein K504DRAFT_527541, partial [Pleomassaria siparia CBS 279.74]